MTGNLCFGNCNKTNYLTFRQLEDFINICAARLPDEEKQFYLQAKSADQLFLKVLHLHQQLEPVQRRVCLLNSLQSELSREIDCIKYNLAKTEEAVTSLEQAVPSVCKCDPKCVLDYQKTYKFVEDINSSLRNTENQMEHVQEYMSTNDKHAATENLANILQIYLQHLENIELKTEKLKDKLNQLEYYKIKCFQLYKFKPRENI